jgi:uncharacterized damage-inducible protein DinB
LELADLRILISYNRWATEKILRKARKIPAGLLIEETPLSHGSILSTLIHIVDTEWYWGTVCWEGRTPLEVLSSEVLPTIDSVSEYWKNNQAKLEDYADKLRDADLNNRIEYHWPRARPRSKVLWHILAHIVIHSTHHRAEIGQYMRTIGYSPGDMDLILFISKQESTNPRFQKS